MRKQEYESGGLQTRKIIYNQVNCVKKQQYMKGRKVKSYKYYLMLSISESHLMWLLNCFVFFLFSFIYILHKIF